MINTITEISSHLEVALLATIWMDKQHREWFREATFDWMSGIDDSGEVLVALDSDDEVLGVSGWMLQDGYVCMRWHGVMEYARGQGVSKELLKHVCDSVAERLKIAQIYELSESEKARDYFIDQGFRIETDEVVIAALRKIGGDFKYVLRLDF